MWFNVPHRVVQPTPYMGQVEPKGGCVENPMGQSKYIIFLYQVHVFIHLKNVLIIYTQYFPSKPCNVNRFAQ